MWIDFREVYKVPAIYRESSLIGLLKGKRKEVTIDDIWNVIQ